MPRARPGARKSTARRRIQRYRSKWTHHVIPERLKRLLSEPPHHMWEEWEDKDKGDSPGYVECEEPTMAELQVKGVPEAEWPYYLGYMKRMLALYRAYTSETLLLEKRNLIEEYVLRGKNRDVLAQVQEVAAECAGKPYVPPPEPPPPPPPPPCFCDKVDGFETGAKAAFWNTLVADPYNIVAAPVHCGSFAARSIDANGTWWYNLTDTLVKWFKWYFMIVPNPDHPPAGFSGARKLIVKMLPWKQVDLYVITGGVPSPGFQIQTVLGPTVNGITQLQSNRWYCCELRIEANKVNAVQRLYVDGILDITVNYDTAAHIFQRFDFSCIQWTLGMDCRSAIDCYCQTDDDTRPTCDDAAFPECYE